jgi:hypothetical protein
MCSGFEYGVYEMLSYEISHILPWKSSDISEERGPISLEPKS